MAVKLHRCPATFLKVGSMDACWRVQKALDDAGIEYEVVKEPLLKGRREEIESRTGQRLLPVIELEDGRMIREESRELAARIRQGRLQD
jgi:glutathione S-transferase